MTANISKGKSKFFYIILFAVTLATYTNTFNNGFVLDDDVVFLQNRYVQQGVSAIPEIVTHGFLYGFNGKNDQSYRPLITTAFAIEQTLFGNDPSSLHKLTVFYYALLCLLLFYFLNLLFRNERPWIAFWISLLFALHPVHTEVVANIKGKDEIFHGIFLLVSFIYAIKYVDYSKIKHLVIALLSYFLALLCKEMAVTYIALLPITLWTFRSIDIKKLSVITSYFLGVLLIYFLVRNAILDTIAFDEKMTVLNNGLAAAKNVPDRIATTFYIFANYIKLLFYPHPLAWDYSYPHFPIVSFGNPLVILTVLGLVAIGIVSLLKMRTKNEFAYTFLFFIISFSIVSNFFILIGCTLGERFLFFPSIAFCMFLVLAIYWLAQQIQLKNKKIITTLLIVISASYALKTMDRNNDWKDNHSLFQAGVIATPNNSRAVSAIGSMNRELAERSRNQQEQLNYYKKAIVAYQKSIQLLPSNSSSHYNLGVIYMTIGRNDQAKEYFQNAIRIEPRHLNAHNNLGVMYFKENKYQEALELFTTCLKINPDFPNAIANLGAVYHNLGDVGKAKEYYLRAIELNPNDVNSKNNLSKLNQ